MMYTKRANQWIVVTCGTAVIVAGALTAWPTAAHADRAALIYSADPPPVRGEDGTLLTPTWSGLPQTTVAAPSAAGAVFDVAIVASASGDVTDPLFTDPRDKLLATGLFASVTTIHAGLETPTVAQLDAFDAVLAWTNFDLADSAALGDNLADYVDGGGGVVVAVFAGTSAEPNRFLSGRWETEGYSVLAPQNGNTNGPATLGLLHEPTHPTVVGVGSFDGGPLSARPKVIDLNITGTGIGTVIADWNDGKPLVAVRDDLAGRRVDLGFYPPSSDATPFLWDSATDGDVLLANALFYVGGTPAPDVELQLVALASASEVAITTDPQTLPGVLTANDCYPSFELELWVSDTGVLNTGIIGFYVDLAYDPTVLEATALSHTLLFNILQEGTIDQPGGSVTNFGGSTFTPQGLEPEWAKLGRVSMSVLNPDPTTVTSSLGLAGVAVSARAAPAPGEISFGTADLDPAIAGDADFDCDLDLADVAQFQRCIGMIGLPPRCQPLDFDGDDTIDLSDWDAFTADITGP